MIIVKKTLIMSTPIAWNMLAKIATRVEGTPISSFWKIFISFKL